MSTFPYLSLAYNLSWVFLNAFILRNGHPYLTEQSLILAVAVMFSLHVYLQIDVRTCIYWSYVIMLLPSCLLTHG